MANQFLPQDKYELEKLLTTMLCLKMSINEYEENHEKYFTLYVVEFDNGEYVGVHFETAQRNTWNNDTSTYYQFDSMAEFVNWLYEVTLTK